MTQPAVESKPDNMDQWIAKLQGADLPAMGQVVNELNQLLNNPDSSAQQVAEVILRDASLTARVLKVANSVTHSQSPMESSSISQSVVKLGVMGIKSICISVMLVESLLRRPNVRERLLFCLSRAFYAAIQAQNLLSDETESNREEVFIAALLRHLGEMLFWSSSFPQVEKSSARVVEEGVAIKEIADELGFDFDQLTAHFAQQWQLGDLLLESLQDSEEQGELVSAVVLGDRISAALSEGWQTHDFREVVSDVASLKGIDDSQALECIRNGVDEAIQMAESYSAFNVSDFMQAQAADIESFLESNKLNIAPAVDEGSDQQEAETEGNTAAEVMQPDLERQMVVLDSLWKMIGNKSNMNTIFNMMVDGLHHSLGLERVVIAITNPERTQLSAKYVRGEDSEVWRKSFAFSMHKREDNILAYCIDNREPIWVCDSYTPSLMHLVTDEMKKVIGDTREFVCAPIYSSDKPIAVFYADRRKTGADISEAQFQSFCRFAQQACAGLSMLA